ncbi:MAG: hypothetical protein JWR83_1694, partial [Aeromicrobium sp.]|nr:hypothetical protein [Aeromicrobium sp.]
GGLLVRVQPGEPGNPVCPAVAGQTGFFRLRSWVLDISNWPSCGTSGLPRLCRSCTSNHSPRRTIAPRSRSTHRWSAKIGRPVRRITCPATTAPGWSLRGLTMDDLSAADPGPRAVRARGGHAQRNLLPKPSRWPRSRSELAGDRPCSLANQVADVLATKAAAGRDHDADCAHGFAIGVEDRAGQ